MKGIFITFEGIEGSGKTTQAIRAEKFLMESGYRVLRTFEPGATFAGEKIRHVLLNRDENQKTLHPITELLLFSADRSQHVQEVIIPALEDGIIVICDRYTDSTTAYQGGGRDINLRTVYQIHEIATLGIYPVRTYLLDLPVEIGLNRIKQRGNILDRLEVETIEFHQRIRDCFLNIARENPQRVMVIDATQSEDTITEIIQRDLRRLCQQQ
ncbi:MAG TPA: dTMP kinase [Candidatus Hydrogenedens sp.]|nr:dTMP kinase [Candidatus Hydrogenedens sp.]HOL19658.1 dTMP kinase [Candidatus Hydrogenedens sp.]HPP57724.1 dTMP kinase [Candidatus Hydrogenedens sp.]